MSVLLRGWDSPAAFCRVGIAHQLLSCLDRVVRGRCPPYVYFRVLARPPGRRGCSGLQLFKRKVLCDEAHRAVGEGEVGPARMAAAEDAGPILQRGEIASRRHPVVDRLREC